MTKVLVPLPVYVEHPDPLVSQVAIRVMDEIKRQDEKWGASRSYPAPTWMQILTEEVGEAAQEGNNIIFGAQSSEKMETELIQVAAVAIQAAAALKHNRLIG